MIKMIKIIRYDKKTRTVTRDGSSHDGKSVKGPGERRKELKAS